MIITGTQERYMNGSYVHVPFHFSVTTTTVSFKNDWERTVKYVQKPVIDWRHYRKQDNSGNWYHYWYARDYERQAWYPHKNAMESVEVSFKVWDNAPTSIFVVLFYIEQKLLRGDSFSLELDTKGKAQWERYLSSLSFV